MPVKKRDVRRARSGDGDLPVERAEQYSPKIHKRSPKRRSPSPKIHPRPKYLQNKPSHVVLDIESSNTDGSSEGDESSYSSSEEEEESEYETSSSCDSDSEDHESPARRNASTVCDDDDEDDDDDNIGPTCWLGQQLIGAVFSFIFGFAALLLCGGFQKNKCMYASMSIGGAMGVYAMGTVFAENRPFRLKLFLATWGGAVVGIILSSVIEVYLDAVSLIFASSSLSSLFATFGFGLYQNPHFITDLFLVPDEDGEKGSGGGNGSKVGVGALLDGGRTGFKEWGFALKNDYLLNARTRASLRKKRSSNAILV